MKDKQINGEWDGLKFKQGFFSLLNKELWGKDITQLINVRKLIIYGVIVIGFFGWAYWKGKSTNPINIDCKQLEGFTAKVIANYRGEHEVSFKNGQMLWDGKTVKAGQVPNLKPYGISFQPELLACYGKYGKSTGLGVEVLYFYDLNLDLYGATDKTANIGLSYDLKNISNMLQNSSVGVSYGKKIGTGETDYKVYFKLKF